MPMQIIAPTISKLDNFIISEYSFVVNLKSLAVYFNVSKAPIPIVERTELRTKPAQTAYAPGGKFTA